MGNKASTMTSTTTRMMTTGDNKSVSVSVKSFKVLTYNVWFANYAFSSRMTYIIGKTLLLQPDVCCFQEVVPAFAAMLQNHAELNKLYVMSDFTAPSYGTITLARREFSPRFDTVEFPTRMGRSLLKTVCVINGVDVVIGNVHLESMSSEDTRRKQLKISEKAMKKYSASILVGDFNFCSERNFHSHNHPNAPLENDVLQQVMPRYVDVWPTLHNVHSGDESDLGYTFDSEVNRMIQQTERMRYDRVIYRCSGGKGNDQLMTPSEITRVGVQPLEPAAADGQTEVWPSDHFGLLTTFQMHGADVDLLEVTSQSDKCDEAPPIPPPYSDRKRPVVALEDIQRKQQTLATKGETVVTKKDGTRYVERINKVTGEVTQQLVGNVATSCSQCGDTLGFQLEKVLLCPSCLAQQKSRALESEEPLLLSDIRARVSEILQSAVRQENPVRLLAIDFDATICQIHTYGRWRGSAAALAAHTRPVFRVLLEEACGAVALNGREGGDDLHLPASLRIGIVTFSGQKDLIREVLEILVGPSAAGRIFLRTARKDWTVPDSYVPTNAFMTGKQPHIASIIEEIFQESGEVIGASQVLLIDDDVKNIACAKEAHHRTVAFPLLPLPGIHMRSPAMEASGVRVLHRCQLSNGALLCISNGSVINFAAEGQGAIVNAANSGGLGGGGVDGAISRAGGGRLLAARKAWPQDSRGNRIPTGECRFTGPDSFGDLRVSHVLHTAGPNYRVIEGLNACNDVEESLKQGDDLLAASYCNSMRCAKELHIELLGFSLISAGVFRGPRSLRSVLSIAVDTIAKEAYEQLREVHLVAYSQEEVDVLLSIVTESPPPSLQRGAGGRAAIQQFMNDLSTNSLS